MGTVILKIKPSIEPDLSYELRHHGIKGQRKGIRRWQNEDGSLTPAGKIRYGSKSRGGSDPETSDGVTKSASATSTGGGTITKSTPTSGSGSSKGSKDKTISDVSDALDSHKEYTKDKKNKGDDDDDDYVYPSTAVSSVKTATNAATSITDSAANIAGRKRVNVPRMDLRNKTDDEMRREIARDRLEEDYDKQFNVNRRKAEAGRQRVVDTWKTIGDGVKMAGGIATIILLIRAARKT